MDGVGRDTQVERGERRKGTVERREVGRLRGLTREKKHERVESANGRTPQERRSGNKKESTQTKHPELTPLLLPSISHFLSIRLTI